MPSGGLYGKIRDGVTPASARRAGEGQDHGDGWTARRVAQVMERAYGVPSHRDHGGRLLPEAGCPSTGIPSSERRNAMSRPSLAGMKKSRRARADDRQGAAKRAFLCCRWLCVCGYRAGRPPFSLCRWPTITSRPSEASPLMADCFCKCVLDPTYKAAGVVGTPRGCSCARSSAIS